MNMALKITEISHELNIGEKDKEDIEEYLEHNEWGLAFEVLCAAIQESNIKISQENYEIINMIGNQMELDHKLWSALESLMG